jgi:hypothetical protein
MSTLLLVLGGCALEPEREDTPEPAIMRRLYEPLTTEVTLPSGSPADGG